MADTAAADEDYRIVSTAVDKAFYRTVYPELNRADIDPIRHYLKAGWRQGRDPAPWFSVRAYLANNPDVAESGAEPLAHYLRHGGDEGRAIAPSEHAGGYLRASGALRWDYEPGAEAPEAEPEEPEPPFSEAMRALIAPEFDAGFYFETNAYLADEGVDPLEHFLAWGWREGRDPNADFSVDDYLREYPDVAQSGINPFVHYVASGRAEGRRARSSLGFRYRIIASQHPLEARIAEAEARTRKVERMPAQAFVAAAAASRTGLKDVHLTFSHDDFIAKLGGVQLCIQYEAARIAETGRDHVHIFPSTLWPVLRRTEGATLSVLLNGQPIGAFSAAAIAEGLAAARGAAPRRGARRGSFAIHNLLGHNVDEVLAILGAAGLNAGFFWLHDFTSLCAGYQLLRNDVEDCAAPPADSPACGICLYGEARGPQVAEHERLFQRLRLTVVSPSQTALDFWRSRSAYPTAGELVHPHLRLSGARRAPPVQPGPLRLAFLGMPSAHKGWPIFAALAEKHADDPRYDFLHLGGRRDPRSRIEFHRVAVSLADPRAMQQAVERLQVDVAVVWSIFRETFCLAAYEAVAAGAAVITCPDSANAAAFVASSGFGRVLEDEAALARALASGELAELARAVRRPKLYDLEFSGMTADLLAAGATA